jgi:hypothetical protein
MRDAFDVLHAAFMAFARLAAPIAERNRNLHETLCTATRAMLALGRAIKDLPNA